jgi:hypothetical protein
MSATTWFYLRGDDTVRIVVQGTEVTVLGPGARVRRACFPDEMDAVLYHTSVEQSLVAGGWMLDRRATDAPPVRPAGARC